VTHYAGIDVTLYLNTRSLGAKSDMGSCKYALNVRLGDPIKRHPIAAGILLELFNEHMCATIDSMCNEKITSESLCALNGYY
jgi:hypothetical protein